MRHYFRNLILCTEKTLFMKFPKSGRQPLLSVTMLGRSNIRLVMSVFCLNVQSGSSHACFQKCGFIVTKFCS